MFWLGFLAGFVVGQIVLVLYLAIVRSGTGQDARDEEAYRRYKRSKRD